MILRADLTHTPVNHLNKFKQVLTLNYPGTLLCNEKHQDIVFADYGRTWEVLRKVAHSAAQLEHLDQFDLKLI